ncbi:GFA family protein [Chitiniphilus purpureus]|uniref:GFA family protein n=1 Tax=Chitiniphilus purpureus TaxID=2981137 RepID=A0ABY6DS18_9NEIS|nr:GFA family protein [Chitiniphilus sp. CD1]UXY14698.1 GFA family protein [Chitiniphilus sp. CD1]
MALRTYTGSCHCGAVRFEAEVDLEAGTSRCNCSICFKGRFWKAVIPASGLHVLQGEAELASYRFSSHSVCHLFCRRCGIKPFGRVRLQAGDFVAVNVACLDDVDDAVLAALPVQFEDGRHEHWDRAPDVTTHL